MQWRPVNGADKETFESVCIILAVEQIDFKENV